VPQPGSCDPDTPLAQVVLRYTAPGSGEFNDMQQVMFSHVDVAGTGGQQAAAAAGTPLAIGLPVALERPRARGHLELASTNPRIPPRIELNFAADPEDLRRLMAAVRLAWQIAHQPEIARHTHHIAQLTEKAISPTTHSPPTSAPPFHPVPPLRHRPDDTRRPDGRDDQRCRSAPSNLQWPTHQPHLPRASINLATIMIPARSDWMRGKT
jgi:choline dehydrogenase